MEISGVVREMVLEYNLPPALFNEYPRTCHTYDYYTHKNVYVIVNRNILRLLTIIQF